VSFGDILPATRDIQPSQPPINVVANAPTERSQDAILGGL